MFGRKQQMKYNINTYQIYFKENKIFTSPKNLIVYKKYTFNFQKMYMYIFESYAVQSTSPNSYLHS